MNGKWKVFGKTVIGPGHIKHNLPNQDALATKRTSEYECIAIADGVGSKPHSDIFSKAVCQSVLRAIEKYNSHLSEIKPQTLFDTILEYFKASLKNYSDNDGATTCIFTYRANNRVLMAMYGDGLASILMKNGKILSFKDDKTDSFSNIVSPIFLNSRNNNWKFLETAASDCMGIFLCTDGISDDLSDENGFVKEFVYSYAKMSKREACKSIRDTLINWPVPRHSDDKTIACLCNIKALKYLD